MRLNAKKVYLDWFNRHIEQIIPMESSEDEYILILPYLISDISTSLEFLEIHVAERGDEYAIFTDLPLIGKNILFTTKDEKEVPFCINKIVNFMLASYFKEV